MDNRPESETCAEALRDAVAHLAGAVSAYEKYAARHGKRSVKDPFYQTRMKDFSAALCRSKRALWKFNDPPSEVQNTQNVEETDHG